MIKDLDGDSEDENAYVSARASSVGSSQSSVSWALQNRTDSRSTSLHSSVSWRLASNPVARDSASASPRLSEAPSEFHQSAVVPVGTSSASSAAASASPSPELPELPEPLAPRIRRPIDRYVSDWVRPSRK